MPDNYSRRNSPLRFIPIDELRLLTNTLPFLEESERSGWVSKGFDFDKHLKLLAKLWDFKYRSRAIDNVIYAILMGFAPSDEETEEALDDCGFKNQ